MGRWLAAQGKAGGMLFDMDIKKDWKGIAATVVVVAGILIAAWYAITSRSDSGTALSESGKITAVFVCESSRSIEATFDNDEQTVRLALSDGRELTVPRAISADGARYANSDESFVFWNKGNTAFIQELGATTYSGCVTNS